jgi:hypothetical protein
MRLKSYEEGVAVGRKQIIRVIKKYYDEMYSFEPASNLWHCSISVPIPEPTLCKYFKEIKQSKRII